MPPFEDSIKPRLQEILGRDLAALEAGNIKYGESWRKQGGPGAYFTISRKLDRYTVALEKAGYDLFKAIRDNPASDGTWDGKDSLMDDLRDIRHYYALVEEYMSRPEVQP